MSEKKRKEYLILTAIAFAIGLFLYGMIAVSGREILKIPLNGFLTFIIYGLLGGVMIGGLLSGWLLFINIIKGQKLYIKIICVVFFPFTYMAINCGGVLTFIPYEIYNCIKLVKKEFVA